MKKEETQGKPSTYAPHECYDYRSEIWHNHKEYNYISCGICGRITHFRWKKWLMRLKMYFWDGIKSN